MANLLNGITHAIVTVPSRKDSEQSGIRANVQFCYGPGDETAIGNIHWVYRNEITSWRVPHVPIIENGIVIQSPVFKGELLEKLCQEAFRVLEHIRKQKGNPSWGKRYRVLGTGIDAQVIEETL